MCLVHGDVWGTLALARRMESMNMHGRFVKLCSGASNRRKAGKEPGHDVSLMLFVLVYHVFHVHIVISTYAETKNSIADAISHTLM